ncbi:MAG: DNA polymerase III subunit delta [Chloroflexi bacterium]|nr:DNA polymerase III subunit delta [Chloroflexota bacterium]
MLYLFFGPDDYTRQATINALKAAFPPDAAAFNVVVLHGKSIKLNEVRTACEAYPVFHDRRLVIVHDLLKHAKSAEMRDGLKSLVQRLPSTTDLVLNESDAPDSRLSVVKDIQALVKTKQAEQREFNLREGNALIAWMQQEAQSNGVQLRPDAAQHLANYVGSDGWMLHNEIAKLAAYVGENGTISIREVDLLVADETETNLFNFIDALSTRRGAAAVQGLNGLLADDAAPLYILTMIARQARLMLAAQSAGRVAPDELAKLLGQKPFVARKAAEQARNFSPTELRMLHERVVQIDHGIKTGKIDAEGALASLVGDFGFVPNRK